MAQNLIIMSNVRIITKSTELPEMDCRDYFHSTDLFKILEQTPGCSPYMVVVTDEQDRIVAHLLAMINRRGSWIPPYLYSAGRVYGEGQYETEDASEIARFSKYCFRIRSSFGFPGSAALQHSSRLGQAVQSSQR